MEEEYFKGRGAQIKTENKFQKERYVTDHPEGLDEPLFSSPETQIFYESPQKVVNKVTSPDLGMMYSINPYQGCEHGCIYCYARNTHEYWGFNAGLDFESKIIVKKNAPTLLEKFILHPDWNPVPISVSGNTDCYQPIERKMEITRGILKVLANYRHPVGMITKHIHAIAPKYVKVKVTAHHGGEPAVTETGSSSYKAASRAFEEVFGKTPIPTRDGGSIPIVALFKKELGLDTVLMGFGFDSDAIHSPNEHYGIKNFVLVIETIISFFKHFGKA